ncbi:cytochrome c-type biogenesis protein [Necropsobacter massiliensis]|uniref:cytochrome c-type biogenesis protein n=1 Tax=Necropsobacter massiliensis TaxID=1400001 RepID=UPI000595DF88|nr:cytochrome c-type biogenesis protein CcmH [Necropsobacter massiliensis]
MTKTFYFLTALLTFAISFAAAATIDALDFSSAQQEKDYQILTQELRCPQCQNNNIADSNATIAVDMRAKVFELLQEGKSKQDIVEYMVARYGNFVTYDPPLTVATVILWAAPAALIIFGIFFIVRRKPQRTATRTQCDTDNSALNAEQQRRLQALLNDKEQ